MRIISPFKDYYDSAMVGSHDDSLVYVRRTETYSNNHGEWAPALPPSVIAVHSVSIFGGRLLSSINSVFDAQAHRMVVVLAGKAYQGLKCDGTVCWTSEQFRALGPRLKAPLRLKSNHDIGRWRERVNLEADEFFQFRENNALMHRCLEHNVPLIYFGSYPLHGVETKHKGESLFLLPKNGIHVNPNLHLLEFIKAMNPFQVYQELSMFLGNIASPDNTPINILDKDRIVQHGFDKLSFRKAPTKRI